MNRKILITLFAMLFQLSSCDVLEQAADVVQFAQCDFSVDHVGIDEIGGVSLKNIQKPENINPLDMIALTRLVMMGKLPVTMNVSVKATNNQSLKAGISGLDWELFMKENKYGSGSLNQAVEVLPGQSTVFPVSVEFDLLGIVKSDNIQQVLDIVFNLDKPEKLKQLDIKLQLKPYYKVGSEVQEYPGVITIRP